MYGGRALFNHRSVLLRALIHLINRGVDLAQAGGLLLGSSRDFCDSRANFIYLRDDTAQGLARLANQLGAGLDLM